MLGKLFRRLFLPRLVALHDAGRLAFFGAIEGADRQQLMTLATDEFIRRSHDEFQVK